MIDEALKRAGIILGETKWCMADLQDAMLRFADERLEMAAAAVESRHFAAHAAHIIRSFKSTPPPPPETREQYVLRVASYEPCKRISEGELRAPPKCSCFSCSARRALQEHGEGGK